MITHSLRDVAGVKCQTSGTATGRRLSGLQGAIYSGYPGRFQHSIKDQLRTCLEWADRNGVVVERKHMYRDKVVSGRRSRRRSLQQLTAALGADEVDVLIVFGTNRLFRKM